YTEQSALEVVQGLAVKLMSNYTNAIAQIPLDEPAQPKAWKKPSLRG
ncbi:MAG: carboxymuconolactone decarboxylase family protein, partial [Robiginitomaculum sp.]|nr:carboxymuconolactone decarboxylase family protein [Robiginitomaculum sp.]